MFARETRRRRLLTGALVMGFAVGLVAETGPRAAPAAADGFPDYVRRPAYFNFDRPPPAPNWGVIHSCSDDASSSFRHGILTIDTPAPGCFEYALLDPNGVWNRWVSNERGWIVETSLKVDPSSEGSCPSENVGDDDSARLWIHDHTSLVIVGIAPDAVCIVYPDIVVAPFTTTDGFHVYRVESKGRIVRVYVDGELVIDHTLTTQVAGGTRALLFGDGTVGGGSNLTYWDYFSYDVTPGFDPSEWEGSAWPANTPEAPSAPSLLG